MSDMTAPTWISVSEAARAIGISRQAVHQRIQAGTILARKEPTSRTARGYFWAVSGDSVDKIKVLRALRRAYAEDMQNAETVPA
jgi:hypothetical protein